MIAFIELSYYMIESQLAQNTLLLNQSYSRNVLCWWLFSKIEIRLCNLDKTQARSHSDIVNQKPDSLYGILHVTLEAEMKSIASRMSYQSLHNILRLWLLFEVSDPFATSLFCHPKQIDVISYPW